MDLLPDDAWVEIASHLDTRELSRVIRVSKETARVISFFLFVKYERNFRSFMSSIICVRHPSRKTLLLYAGKDMTNRNRHWKYECFVCGRRTAEIANCATCHRVRVRVRLAQ